MPAIVVDRLALARPPASIAVVMLSALGDAVHVLPVLNAVKRTWPHTRITWVIQPIPHRLVADHPAVDEFVVFQRKRGAAALGSYRALRSALRGRHFDLLLNLQVYFKAGLITALLDAPIKLGFDRRRARDLNWLFTTHRIPPQPTAHVQDQYFEFLRYLGIDPEPLEWRLALSPPERAAQQAYFAGLGRTCAIVVGTSKPQKNWQPERYAAVIGAMAERYRLRTILIGGPAPIERELAGQIKQATRTELIDAVGDDVRRLVWLLAGADLVISPDTGPLHIARALDRPVIGLYGYTNPKRYGPYRKYTDLIADGYARYPGEDYPLNTEYRADGMGRITVDMVLEKVDLAVRTYLSEPRG